MKKYILYFSRLTFAKSAIILFVASTILKVILLPIGSLVITLLNLNLSIFRASMQVPDLNRSDFIVGVILAPILETALGQYFPISILSKFGFSDNKKILISALFFSLLHFPVIEFIPSAFGVGLCLSLGFLSRYEYKKHLKKAFLLTTCIHFLHNLFAFLIVLLFKY